MRVYNAAITGSSVDCELTAHNSPIAVMAWNQDATLLASASTKGTILRVHRLPQVLSLSLNWFGGSACLHPSNCSEIVECCHHLWWLTARQQTAYAGHVEACATL